MFHDLKPFNMKKLSSFLILLCFTLYFTNTASAQVRFGIKAGLNLANLTFSNFGELEPDTKMLPSFQVGGLVEMDFSENVGLGVGLQFHGKGTKDGTDGSDAKITLNYIQVPVMIQYRNMGFFAGVGPYAAFGISGKYKEDGESEDVSFGSSEDDDFSALDFGGTVEVGYEFGNLRATASYGMGFANAIPKDGREGTDLKIAHSAIGIALAYLFGGE